MMCSLSLRLHGDQISPRQCFPATGFHKSSSSTCNAWQWPPSRQQSHRAAGGSRPTAGPIRRENRRTRRRGGCSCSGKRTANAEGRPEEKGQRTGRSTEGARSHSPPARSTSGASRETGGAGKEGAQVAPLTCVRPGPRSRPPEGSPRQFPASISADPCFAAE